MKTETSAPGTHQKEMSDKVNQPLVCLQNFLFSINSLAIDDLIFKTDCKQLMEKDKEGVTGYFPLNGENRIVFDGVINAFPVGTFSRHTGISHIRLRGKMDGEIAIQIHYIDDNGERILHEEPLAKRTGVWESPPIPIKGLEGRVYLSCRVKGKISLRHLGWSTTSSSPDPSFLVNITTYQSNRVQSMVHEICSYYPLKTMRMSLLIVDNGQNIHAEELPTDPRLSLISQQNMGASGGVMRGLWKARTTDTDYLVIIADDGMVLHPEVLYRLMRLQSFAIRPLSIGAMMFYLDQPTILHEQGAVIPQKPFEPMQSNGHLLELSHQSIGSLYKETPCDYAGWWLMAAPVAKIPFIPAFFLYLEDILQGILLKKDGVQTIIPPHLFIWQTFGFDYKIRCSFRAYSWFRNELAMRLSSGLPIYTISTILWFFKRIRRGLTNYDYAQSSLLLSAFEDVIYPSRWAHHPLASAELIQKIRINIPQELDFSSRLSKQYSPVKTRKRPRLLSMSQRIFSFLTIAGYLNPVSKSVADDGGYVFRYQGDNDCWQWAGYRQLAVVDENNKGYLCERSWSQMIRILLRTISASFHFFWSIPRLRNLYQRPSLEYEAMWEKTFRQDDQKKHEWRMKPQW
ncbi:MAG: hypothetical protein ACYCTV_06030 [Leptospirales bacterium]